MADWPESSELAQVLNIAAEDDWSTTIDRVLAAAIAKVKLDVGDWDEDVDEPDDALAQAALRMAELMALRPGVLAGLVGPRGSADISGDPSYLALMYGHRRTFGIA